MRRVILCLAGLALFLGGCNFPGDSPLVEENPVPATLGTPPPAGDSPDSSPSPTISTPPTATTNPPTPTISPTGDEPVAPSPTAKSAAPQGETLRPGSAVTISQISMITQSEGWGIGYQSQGDDDRILRTRDGGQIWSDVTPPEPPGQQGQPKKMAWAYFANAEKAWVIYAYADWSIVPPSPRVWVTNDAGQSWQASAVLDLTGQEEFFKPEAFTSPNWERGWLLIHVGGGMHHDYSLLYRTGDGGLRWERIIDPYKTGLQSLGNTGLAFVDENVGWVGKDNMGVRFGAFWEYTQDGGRNWESSFLPAPPELDWMNDPSACRTENILFTSAHTAALLVNCRTYEEEEERQLSYVYVTGDRGQNWQHSKLSTQVDELDFIDYQTGWATGRDIYQSTDGGLSWVKIKTVHWDGQFSFVDAQHGWAVAIKDDMAALVKTNDSGRTWELIMPVMSEE